MTQVPPLVVEHAPAGTDDVTKNTVVTGVGAIVVGARDVGDVGAIDGGLVDGDAVGYAVAESLAHKVNPPLLLLIDVYQVKFDPAVTMTPCGRVVP